MDFSGIYCNHLPKKERQFPHKKRCPAISFSFTLDCHTDLEKTIGGLSEKKNIYMKKKKFPIPFPLNFQRNEICLSTPQPLFQKIDPISLKVFGQLCWNRNNVALYNQLNFRQVVRSLKSSKKRKMVSDNFLQSVNTERSSELFVSWRYSYLSHEVSQRVKNTINLFPGLQSGTKREKHDLLAFSQSCPLKHQRMKTAKKLLSVKSFWTLPVIEQVIRANQCFCRPCRRCFILKIDFFDFLKKFFC